MPTVRLGLRLGISLVEMLVVVVIIMLIASLSLPNMHQARIESNRIETLHNMAMLAEANGMYFHRFRQYAGGLSDLYGINLLEDNRFLQASTMPGTPMDGYFYHYNVSNPFTGFLFFATPSEYGKSGLLTYCVGETAIIFERDFGVLPQESLHKRFALTDHSTPPHGKLMELLPSGRSMTLGEFLDEIWLKANLVVE